MKRTLILSALLLVLTVQGSWGQIPQTISYQGVLTDASSTAVPDGTYRLNFNMYEVTLEGASLWTEAHDVVVVNGIFNVILGSNLSL